MGTRSLALTVFYSSLLAMVAGFGSLPHDPVSMVKTAGATDSDATTLVANLRLLAAIDRPTKVALSTMAGVLSGELAPRTLTPGLNLIAALDVIASTPLLSMEPERRHSLASSLVSALRLSAASATPLAEFLGAHVSSVDLDMVQALKVIGHCIPFYKPHPCTLSMRVALLGEDGYTHDTDVNPRENCIAPNIACIV